MLQTNLFGQPELIPEPKHRNHALCGCFTESEESERKQAAILAYMQKGKSLTVLQALKQFHTTELRKIICRLRNKGHVIESYWHEENGRKKYKVYKIVKS